MPWQTSETFRDNFFASIVPLVAGGGSYDARELNMQFLEQYRSIATTFNSHMQLRNISSPLLTNYVILHAVLH